MEQVGGARTGAREQLDPGSDEPFISRLVDGGEDAIGRGRAILVGGLEGNGRSQWLRKLERRRVVERMDVEPGEEAPRVGGRARPSERARGEPQLPAGGRQCASERARDLRRAAAGEEEERRDDESARVRRAAVTRRLVPPPRIACSLHGLILVRQPDAAARARLPLPPGGRLPLRKLDYAGVLGERWTFRAETWARGSRGDRSHDPPPSHGQKVGCKRPRLGDR